MLRLISYTLLYLLGVSLLSSVLAWGLASFVDFEFHKIFSRLLLLLIAISLVPLWRMNALSAEMIGFGGFSWRRLGASIAFSIAMLLPLMLLFVVSGFRIWDTRVELFSAEFAQQLLLIGIGAILVGLFEETLFRGFLQRLIGDRIGVSKAIWLLSLCYAMVHFLRPSEPTDAEIGLFTGLGVLANAFAGVFSFMEEITSFATLIVVGVILGFTRERLGLWVAIGLHAGWVMGIRTFKELTSRDIVNPFAEWTGSYDDFIGPLALFWLAFGFVLFRLYQHYVQNLQVGSR